MIDYKQGYVGKNHICTNDLSEAQRTLYYMAENLRMDNRITQEGYDHFQEALEALSGSKVADVLEKISAEIRGMEYRTIDGDVVVDQEEVLYIIEEYKGDNE